MELLLIVKQTNRKIHQHLIVITPGMKVDTLVQ